MTSSKTYEWKVGRIMWGGEQFNAFVISNLTPEEIDENPFSAIWEAEYSPRTWTSRSRGQNGRRSQSRTRCCESGASLAQGREEIPCHHQRETFRSPWFDNSKRSDRQVAIRVNET